MAAKSKPRILCVDDEPQILEGLSPHLRRHYELDTATSGLAALEMLAREPTVAVIMSDMRMPGMDGATFLARARQLAPDAVRMLLTGQADIDAAAAAINEGQIFRFLTKPCPPPTLLAAFGSAVEQHELITAERVLLEQTLHGSIKTLTDVLALVSPTSFGRATRIKQLVSDLAERLAIRERWQVEVAAMLSQLGCITLPAETAESVYYGRPLSADEQKLVDRLPALTEELLGNIPRLEAVREILKTYPKPYRSDDSVQSDPRKRIVAQGAQLLKVAVDFDALESSEVASSSLAVDTLRGRVSQYAPEVLQALVAVRGGEQASEVRELPASELRSGMILAQDVKLPNGVLLVARGYVVNERFLERLRNFTPGPSRKVTWRVVVQAAVVMK
jgi:response regulator RpfG family c-di-GMP phosphodiesterase